LEREAERLGIRITSVCGEGTEDDEPTSILVRRLLQAVSEHELAMISARTKAALAQKKARGERLGRPPYGFSVVNGHLQPNKDFKEMVWAVRRYHSWKGCFPDEKHVTMRELVKIMIEREPDAGWNLKRVHSIHHRWLRKDPEEYANELRRNNRGKSP
jgi:hypothetical protein